MKNSYFALLTAFLHETIKNVNFTIIVLTNEKEWCLPSIILTNKLSFLPRCFNLLLMVSLFGVVYVSVASLWRIFEVREVMIGHCADVA
jgi:uncharacterized membrane protein